jgi:Lrp/AsnC family leucine-responsive transcriptional regulator
MKQKMPIEDLDAIDRRILENLQRDGRLTNLDLAERVGLSPSPCLRRVRRLEAEGLIESYGARLDRKKVGLGLTAFVSVNIERHAAAEAEVLRNAMMAMPEVIACYITSGEFDFLLHVVVPDLDEYRRFSLEGLVKLKGLKDFRSSFVIDTVKENAPLPLRHLG